MKYVVVEPPIMITSKKTGSTSLRIAIKANKCVFNGKDVLLSYPLDVDLIRNKNVESCSNE